jgi:hypothetical protein
MFFSAAYFAAASLTMGAIMESSAVNRRSRARTGGASPAAYASASEHKPARVSLHPRNGGGGRAIERQEAFALRFFRNCKQFFELTAAENLFLRKSKCFY